MKLAILLCGHIRTWNDCKLNFEETFGKENVDIFVRTYDVIYGYHPYIKNTINFKDDVIMDDDEIKKLFMFSNSNITLRYICIENQNIVDNEVKQYDSIVNNDYLSQYRNFKKNFDAVKSYSEINNIQYDFIIKTRMDLKYKGVFNIHNKYHSNNMLCSVGTQDLFFMAKIDILEKFLNDIFSQFDINKSKSINIHDVLSIIIKNYHNVIPPVSIRILRKIKENDQIITK